MRRLFPALAATFVLAAAGPEAGAGTGIYDMGPLIGAAHPFAATPAAPPPGPARPTLPAGSGVGLYDMRPFLNQRHPFAAGAPPRSPFAPVAGQPSPPPSAAASRSAAQSAPQSRPSPRPAAEPRARPVPARSVPATSSRRPPGVQVTQTRVGREASEQFYVGGAIGLAVVQESDNAGTSLAFDTENDPGIHLSGTVGFEFQSGLRLEFEMAWRRAEVHSLNFTQTGSLGVSTGSQSADGAYGAMAMMFNGAWAFDVDAPIRPFVLGGLGIARVAYSDVKLSGVPVADDSAMVLAWQLGLGGTVEVGERWLVDFAYRLFSTLDPEFTDVTGTTFDGEFTSHEFLVGVRYLF